MKSLQTKFLAVNICAMTVLALLTGGAGIFTTTRLLLKDAEQTLRMECDVQKVELDLLLNSVEQSVRIMSTLSLNEIESVEKFSSDDAYRGEYTAHMLESFGHIANHTEGALAYYLRCNPKIAPSTGGSFASQLICHTFKHSPVYRIGGDEFVVIMKSEDYHHREKLMMQFEASMQNAFAEADGEKIAVSIAKGIAMYQNELSSFQACFLLADALMYKNKNEMKHAFVEGV